MAITHFSFLIPHSKITNTMAVNNRATRFNRAMMFGTMFLGLVVIGVCIGFMYFAFDQQKQKQAAGVQENDSTLTIMVDEESARFD